MKRLQAFLIGLLTAGAFSIPASADHAAIVYCALEGNGDVVVVGADYSLGGGVPGTARSGRHCAAVLHEIMRSGYQISSIDSPHVARLANGKEASGGKSIPESPNGLIVFVLENTHK